MTHKIESIEERKRIQLEMLIEIDSFCRSHRICYSLAFGTLLGAIRHRGFIPWDDDVDIMMPLVDMKRFKAMFHSESMVYHDVDDDPDFQYAFSRIANTRTYNKIGLIVSSYGICIDLYPVIHIPEQANAQKKFWESALALEKKYISFVKWNSRVIRYLPIRRLPGFRKTVKRFRNYLFNASDELGNCFYIIAGPLKLREKMTYDFDLFEQLVEVNFENHSFYAISSYDKYLQMRYGDYMKLPSEDQRYPYHSGHYYWKHK